MITFVNLMNSGQMFGDTFACAMMAESWLMTKHTFGILG